MKMRRGERERSRQGGFTLIEVMVVLVILAILGTFVTVNVIDRPDQARTEKAKNDIRAIENALSLYRLDTFAYPTTEEGLASLVPKYLPRLPKDPWNKEYQYLSPGDNGDIDIFTYGSDGIQGGDEQRSDIGNWNLE